MGRVVVCVVGCLATLALVAPFGYQGGYSGFNKYGTFKPPGFHGGGYKRPQYGHGRRPHGSGHQRPRPGYRPGYGAGGVGSHGYAEDHGYDEPHGYDHHETHHRPSSHGNKYDGYEDKYYPGDDHHGHDPYDPHGHGKGPYGYGKRPYGHDKKPYGHGKGHYKGSKGHSKGHVKAGTVKIHDLPNLPTSTPADMSLEIVRDDLTNEVLPRGDSEEAICQGYIPDCSKDNHYRSFDGTCTNLDKPAEGAAGTAYKRLVGPHYELVGDSNSAQAHTDLPDPDILSKCLLEDLPEHVPASEKDSKHTMFAVAFMQYIFSDISKRGVIGPADTNCCDSENPNCAGTPEFVGSTEGDDTCPSIEWDEGDGDLNELCYMDFKFGEETMRDCDTGLVCVWDKVDITATGDSFQGICRTECGAGTPPCQTGDPTVSATQSKMCYEDDTGTAVCHCMPNEVDLGATSACAQTCSSVADCANGNQCIDPDRDGTSTCYFDSTCTTCGTNAICYLNYVGGTSSCFYPHKYLDGLGLTSCEQGDTCPAAGDLCVPYLNILQALRNTGFDGAFAEFGITTTQGVCLTPPAVPTGALCDTGALQVDLDGVEICVCDFGSASTDCYATITIGP